MEEGELNNNNPRLDRPLFVRRDSLAFDIGIDPYTLPFVYLLLSNLLYMLPADWENPGALNPPPSGCHQTNYWAQVAPPLAY